MMWYLLLLICVISGTTLSVDVNTQYGPVRGETVAVNNGRDVGNVDAFRAIPYGKDTSGPRRFLDAEDPDPWVDVRDALDPGPGCPQPETLLVNYTNPDWNDLSEDCLHLDIYTPDAFAGPDTYPVMIYIYGGGYYCGANIQYPGHFLARHGVVVVVLNYRMGQFGFAYTGNAAAPGNLGLRDLKKGIEFVRNNIRNFGGDPDRITLFGQSSGAGATGLMVVSPESKDLFQQAFTQSGTEMNMWSYNRPTSDPESYTYQVARDMGCPILNDFQMMDCLRTKSFEDIIANSSIRCTPGYFCLGMAPVIDGPGGFLPKSPKELREDGDIMRGPLMSGVLQDDGSLFSTIFVPGTLLGCCNRTRFEEIIRDRIVGYFARGDRFDKETQEAMFQAINWHYTYWPYLYENELNRDSFIRIVTDVVLGTPWDWQIKQHYKVNSTFTYVYDYLSSNSTLEDWQGVPHTAEVPYVWGYPMLQYNEGIRQKHQLMDDAFNDQDISFSLYFQELITNFVKYGDPTFVDVQKPLGGSTVWPTFDENDYSSIYLSYDQIDPIYEYRQRDYAFWNEYMGYVMFDVISGEEPPVVVPEMDDF